MKNKTMWLMSLTFIFVFSVSAVFSSDNSSITTWTNSTLSGIEPEPDPAPVGDIGTALVVKCNGEVCVEFEYGDGMIKIDGHGVEWWRWQAIKAQRKVERLQAQKKVLLRRAAHVFPHSVTSKYAIHLASIAYDQPESDLVRVAGCETGGTYHPGSYNDTSHHGEHATGLFQFLPSTWRSTPYAHLNIYEPVANSLAAGWMWDVGRRGEWACQ